MTKEVRFFTLIFILGFITILIMLRTVAQEVAQPVALAQVAYAQSTTCATCHPGHYETWHQTYHRTMTQAPSETAVLGNFNNDSLNYKGVTSRFTTENGRFFIETQATSDNIQQYEVAFTVGSRRIQQYVTEVNGRHLRLPVAWNIEDKRWIHLNGGFLDPDDTPFTAHTALWDANCIFCHNVKAQPGYDIQTQTFDSQVAELGVACESCHGPASEHIARNQNPLRRYYLYLQERDPTIYSPNELPIEQQTQLCGHCHGQRIPNPPERVEQFIIEGDPFTAGDDLSQIVSPIFIDSELPGVDLALRFWQDGTPRLTAYEYQGVLLSKEHANTELTCNSCHNVHGGEPEGMIEPVMRGNQGCLQCHSDIEADIPAHTNHNEESDGSQCYACHMPDIVYGVLDIHPSHRIQNPDPSRAWEYDMPEACTLCHVNETAVWAAQALNRTATPSTANEFEIAETIRALLSGDVVQRAVAIHALSDGDGYAQSLDDELWVVPFLLITLEDSYPTLRHFAYRGLTEVTERAQLTPELPPFDYLADEAARASVVAEWWQWWQMLDKSGIAHPGTAVPLDQQLQPIWTTIEALKAQQPNEQISIGE